MIGCRHAEGPPEKVALRTWTDAHGVLQTGWTCPVCEMWIIWRMRRKP